ncbi:MAG TPA: hypothetical protein VEW26_15795 [Allosphingosinicella sp.]|nr:hypothetical protein [Allosphingosinicella sp.]
MKKLLSLLPLAMLGACASMKVQVDVMNPTYAKATALEASLRLEANDLASGSHQQVDAFVAATFGEYERFRLRCLDEAAEAARASNPAEADDILRLKTAGVVSVNQHRTAAREALYEQDRIVAALLHTESSPDIGLERLGEPVSGVLKAALLERRRRMAGVADEVKGYIEASNVECQGAVMDAAGGVTTPATASSIAKSTTDAEDTKQRVEQVKVATVVGGGALLNDRLEAFYVTHAGKEYWSPRYNRAFGEGFFGSTSVAIKMNDTADFSIKGFVFDGRSTAEMVRKVAVQSVGLIATAYGAPISLTKPSGQAASSMTFNNSALVSDVETSLEKARAEEQAYRAALFRIADSVIANLPNLVAGDPTAKSIVKSTFDAYKPVLEATAATTTAPQP